MLLQSVYKYSVCSLPVYYGKTSIQNYSVKCFYFFICTTILEVYIGKCCFQIGTWLARESCVVVTYYEETIVIVNHPKVKNSFPLKFFKVR